MFAPRQETLYGRDASATPAREVGFFLPVGWIFPDCEPTERQLVELLSGLERDETLMQCARLNILVSGHGDYELKRRQEHAIARFCTAVQRERINAFAGQHGGNLPIVFFAGQLRELMRWAARHCAVSPGHASHFDDPAVRERLLKAALIASDVWSRRVYGDKLTFDGDISAVRRRALGAFRRGVEETGLAPHLGIAIGRGLTLFTEYLPRHYPEFARDFEQATGLTIGQYLGCATVMSIFTMQEKTDGHMFIRDGFAAATTGRDLYPRFVDLVSQSPEELAHTFWDSFDKRGYRALRERPVLIARKQFGIVLDPTFFVECVSIGPLFAVLGRAGEQAFARFGNAFEDYVGDILERMYPRRSFLVDRVALGLVGSDAAGREFEIDAAVFDARASVVAEVKAVFLPEQAISSGDPEAFIRAVNSKYSASSKKGERDKGVSQLARSVGAIARGEWTGPKAEFKDSKTIFPVLIVHDSRLDTPALGQFLDAEFRRLLGPVPGDRRVAPLTLMTIEDLENLERSIEKFTLVELLGDYERECPDRMRSLHNHIAFSDFGKKILPSTELIDRSVEILDVLKAQLFPDAAMPDTS